MASTVTIDSSYFSSTSTDAAGTTVEITFPGTEESDNSARFGLGYWSIRGLGAPLTMMLCAAQKPFTLFLYDIVEKNESSSWTSDYFTAKPGYIQDYHTPLWNLPFCVDRQEKRVISQTNAIFAHIGRVCDFMGEDSVTTSQCEQLLDEIYDLRNVMTKFAYSGGAHEDDGDIAKGVLASGMNHLKKLEAWLELQNKNGNNDASSSHLVNGKISAPDFHLFEMLDQYEGLCAYYKLGDLLENLPRLKAFKSSFSGLAENQFYLNSWLHKELPYNNCMARFGSLPGPSTYTHGKSASLATWRKKGLMKMSPS